MKTRFLPSGIALFLLIAALLTPGTLSAQEPPPGCDPAMLAESFAAIQDELAHAQALLSDNDTEGALESFNAAAAQMDQVRALCGGFGVAVGGGEPGVITVEPVIVGPPVMVEPVRPDNLLCNEYPRYCVPLAGGGPEDQAFPNEAPGLRPVLMGPVNLNVVRGLSPEGAPYIGNPDAPIHFLEFLDFACEHCAAYDENHIAPFVEQAVVTGQATYEVRLMRFAAGEYSSNAASAMLCAGEQGAAWEMHDVLFAAYRIDYALAYSLDNIQQMAANLGLDGEALVNCIASERYDERMRAFNLSATDLGVTGTPTMFVRYGPPGQWEKLEDRSLENLLALTAAANQE